jgi:hypothetical protein
MSRQLGKSDIWDIRIISAKSLPSLLIALLRLIAQDFGTHLHCVLPGELRVRVETTEPRQMTCRECSRDCLRQGNKE